MSLVSDHANAPSTSDDGSRAEPVKITPAGDLWISGSGLDLFSL
jgi:hypothetical protein